MEISMKSGSKLESNGPVDRESDSLMDSESERSSPINSDRDNLTNKKKKKKEKKKKSRISRRYEQQNKRRKNKKY